MRRFFACLSLSCALIVGLVSAWPVSTAHAQVNTGLTEVGQTIKLSSTDPRIIAANIINVALGLVGIVLVSLIIYAGFLYMTAGGEAEKTSKAKKIIVSSIVGLIIILSAWAIARFVIERLLQATQGGGGGSGGSQSGGNAGGFGNSGGANVFKVVSISPQGAVSIRNVRVKMLFSRPVDDKTASSIVIAKAGGVAVGGTLEVLGSVVTFTPAAACPAPNANLNCFDADTDFTVQIGGSLRSTQGQTIVCGGFAPPCTGAFHTGSLIDTQPPAVSVIEPLDGQAISADSLVSVKAHATDDSGVSYIEFSDNGDLIDQSAPMASSTPKDFTGDVQWDTAGLPLQSVHQLKATAFDIDAHQTQSSAVNVVVHGASCFNGVKDGDEQDIDCGGTPNTPGYCGACAGGSCSSNIQCASSVCQNGVCVVQPVITAMSPNDGKPGTFVTLQGLNFGISGSVVFLGGPGAQDDVVAQLPAACSQNGAQSWSPTQVIVAVPVGAVTGPVRLTNAASQLFDLSNDAHGPVLPDFLVNDATYPGLCALVPAQGYVGDTFTAVGQGFGSSPSTLSFGSSILSSFSSWIDTQVKAIVPVVGTGKHAVKVVVGNQSSNPISYSVISKSSGGVPTIASLDPNNGPKGEYVTIVGKNFGPNTGTVRFKNKTSGQEALGDVSFPAACADSFWTESEVIVKVPSVFLVGNATIVPGGYTVKIIRSDNAESNSVDFTVKTGNAKPGICAISPTVGPVGTPVVVTGEHFGPSKETLTFHSSVNAVADAWSGAEVSSKVPTGSVTGPVKVAVQGQISNGANFQVRNCNEQAGICSQAQQCCPNGTCISKAGSCGNVVQSAMFAWQSSTGLIPVAPQVVEECSPKLAQPPIPSPAPWDKRDGGNQVCIGATISVRFTTKLDPKTVKASQFKIKKCTSQSNEPCAATQDVQLKGGFPLLQPASQSQDAVFLEPNADFDISSTYLVEVLTGIKGFGPGGAQMEQRSGCANGVGYCFRFKTRASTDACTVGSVSVAPHPYELHDTGATVNYLASPLSSDDACVVLKCDTYDWSWQHGDPNNPDGRAVFETPLKPGTQSGTISCQQVGVAVSETGNVPVSMNATVLPDKVKGTADLYVKFVPPSVEAHGPDCDLACVNALIWARFTVALDPTTIANNVEIRPCANENCIESELGKPLALNANAYKVVSVPKSSEITKRFLQVTPTDANGNLLLIPGNYYRVLLKGGSATGIKGANGVPMTGLNTPDGFAWIFRTKIGQDAFCSIESVDVSPEEKYETHVGARQLFKATTFGKPDACSATGQYLIPSNDVSWKTSDPKIADFINGGMLDTGGQLPPQCNAQCLAMGAQGVFGSVAVCGNGIVESPDPAYCTSFNAKYGGGCTVLPVGAKSSEQCDPGIANNVGLCDPTTCLWKPVAQVPQGTCGNGAIDAGESCDFGRFCMGASPTSTTPDLTNCTSNTDKLACEANGGTCAPRQIRGCSAFCRHTGSASAKSTCGNNDVADGEDCDDGNLNSGDGCSSDCLQTGSQATVASVCGNAILEPGETCEKNKVNDPAFPPGCDPKSCLHTGTVLCDNDPNTPNVNCCGNGAIDKGEDCDDANKDAGDGCSLSCLLEGSSAQYPQPSFCSDGILETGEQCEVALPSSHNSLLSPNISKNAAPVPPKGSKNGDGSVDTVQLATIIGDADPDANGLMSAKLDAVIDGKDGQATYGLQCGFTSEDSCDAGYGLTDAGCCNARPEIVKNYPPHAATGVCRNVQIAVTFNVPMNPASVTTNIQLATEELNATCPTGTVQVSESFQPSSNGVIAWLQYRWRKVIAWVTGNPAYAAIWCSGSVSGSLVPVSSGNANSFVYTLNAALKANAKYRIKFLGDDSTPKTPLVDNNDATKKVGIKSAKGVVVPFDTAADAGPFTWSFTTGANVCVVNTVQVTDMSTEHPLLFTKQAEAHTFTSKAMSLQSGVPVPITPVVEYAWKWNPWTTSANDIIQVGAPNIGDSQVQISSQNKNGNAFAVAWLQITKDTINTPSTTGAMIQGTAPVTVLLCENPWPSLQGPGVIAPFRDKQPTGNGSDSSLTGTIFANGPYFNFSTTYCRDAGAFGTADDLPKLQINYVPLAPVDVTDGILRQYLFTYVGGDAALKKDGIGIRVVANPLHLAPLDWYRWRGFGGSPQPVMVDGYRALKDGTTTYVAAANTKNPGEAIYSNIYVISHNPDAGAVTVGIYDQMVANLTFNINLTQEVSNICMQGNDPNVYVNAPFLVDAKTVTCSSDADCLTNAAATHCGSFKQKLARDTVRLADYQDISRALEVYRQGNVSGYPKLDDGSFLQGLTVSRWPSWQDGLGKAIGMKLPNDPVNVFLTCGRCSQSQAVCTADTECPKGETCKATDVNGATYDPSLCWDTAKHQYLCPRIGSSPSRTYQYRAVNGGQRYELSSEFEIPKPNGANSPWWSPELTQEIKRCTNAGVAGITCDVDADCRSCANPKDMASCPVANNPIVAGACKPVGGRFIYSGACTNVPYGQGGICGDGVIGKQCVGGANNGVGCTVNAECPGGSCTGQELCEIGQTKLADCKTNANGVQIDGLKLQVCNECKEFIDDAALSVCSSGIQCGNGRVDKKCVGGSRNDMACLADADCPSTPNQPPAVCGATSEICDDGKLNGTYGHCNISCNGYASFCGDGQIAPGEDCDLGPQNGAYCSGNCSASCGLDCKSKAPYCGDGVIDAPNETCDGQTVTTVLGICTAGSKTDQPCSTNADCGQNGTCAASGALASCQGVTKKRCATALKQCLPSSGTIAGPNYVPADHTVCQTDDDCSGGTICRSLQDYVTDCTSDVQCSVSGIPGTCDNYPTAHVRSCDAAGQNKCTYPVLPSTNSSWSECKILNFCGDGIIDAPAEQCDDGSKNGDTKACTSSCKKNVCGDGKPYINVEECDNGSQNGQVTCNADYGSNCSSCSLQCKFLPTSGGYCGDGQKNGGEQCDGMDAVNVFGNQVACPAPGKPAAICPMLQADCLHEPCQKTKETGVTCSSLGYDFATNATKPKLIPLDSALNVLHTGSSCDSINEMKQYEYLAYKACLGLVCKSSSGIDPNDESQLPFANVIQAKANSKQKYALASNQGITYSLQFKDPMPTNNQFWQCVKDIGPSLGVGIQTDGNPELLQCSSSCGFSGCGKCSDETGMGIIGGQLIDAVYNQVVPFAKVSLFYKGSVIAETTSDADGKFQFTNLNDRAECSQYKIVVDKYDDNPCTGSDPNRPNCGLPGAPNWNYSYTVKEDERGGYWPYTSPIFTVENFSKTVSPQGDGRIFLFPRPGTGEAYYTIMWDVPFSGNYVLGYLNHFIVPKAFAYTKPANASSTITTCDYDNRPTQTGQCMRDVTYSSMGSSDMTQLPYAQFACHHTAGEVVGGFAGNSGTTWNGCPVEGYQRCIARLGGSDPTGLCSKGVPYNGPPANAPCQKTWWDTCTFYKNGPLVTYFKYAAYQGTGENVKMLWIDGDNHSIFSALNTNNNSSSYLKTLLKNKKFHAVVSTDKQIVSISADSLISQCGDLNQNPVPNQDKDCKVWDLGTIIPLDGSISVANRLLAGRPEGAATYDYNFQGAQFAKYCELNKVLYKANCTQNSDCSLIPGATCKTIDYNANNKEYYYIWSKANF